MLLRSASRMAGRAGAAASAVALAASNGPRFYASPLEAAREAGRSRVFQGIHFQFSNEDGRRARSSTATCNR